MVTHVVQIHFLLCSIPQWHWYSYTADKTLTKSKSQCIYRLAQSYKLYLSLCHYLFTTSMHICRLWWE